MFEILPTTLRIPFMKFKWPMTIISLLLTGMGLYFIATKGFRYGVDFAGGVQLVLAMPKDSSVDAEQLRKASEALKFESVFVQSFGRESDGSREYMMHFPTNLLNETAVTASVREAVGPAVKAFRFVGMEKAYLTLDQSMPIDALKTSLKKVSFGLVELQDVSVFGRETQNEYQLTFSSMANALAASLTKELGLSDGQTLKVLRVEFVGAKVGSDLRTSALLSFLVTMLIIFIYIFIRFDFVYAPGVVLALLHDVIITAGFFAMTGMEFDLTIVAALLTLAGYSINDTIVVYDRIREVAASMKGKRFSDIIDLALNQTLARTIITGSTTLLATGALFLYGGPVIHGFAAAFLIGIVVGTYSSVFVASPVILATQKLLGASQESKVGRAAA